MKDDQGLENRIQRKDRDPEVFFYEIKVKGLLDAQRSKWFQGMTLIYVEDVENGSTCTLITGPVIDQPALHGLLTMVRDLNLTLISVRRFTPITGRVEEVSSNPGPSDIGRISPGGSC